MPAPTTEPKPPKTRKPRAPSEYIVQQNHSMTNEHDEWMEIELDGERFSDVAEAIGYLKDNGMEGVFRILAIKKVLTLKAETVKKMRVV